MKIYIIGHISPDLDCIASTVEYAEFLKKQKRYVGAELIPVRAGEPNKETTMVFQKFGISMPVLIDNIAIEPTDAFILVDHNEESQRSPKIVAAQIIEIIDHHKINVNFNTPVRLDVKPLGSTSTLIYEHFETYGLKPSKEITSLILASIISDTVALKSSTTTGTDSDIAKRISSEYDIDFDKLTLEIFKAKSDLSGLSAKEIVSKDFKIFNFASPTSKTNEYLTGTKVYIAQVETADPQEVLQQKTALIKELENIKVEHNVGQAYLFVTDILKLNSTAVYCTDVEKRILEKAFTGQGHDNIIDVGPRISRKKDIAPEIEKALKSG